MPVAVEFGAGVGQASRPGASADDTILTNRCVIG
ncbi:hypothetical protein M2169_000570 [Streptomyces sp. MJP52]|nr:hypothetical protein [Streptomyces sp. MJP52]